jgi:hypothetical protein
MGIIGSCERFLVYQVSPDEVRLIAVRPTLAADHAEDRNVARAALIDDCQIVYVQSIGGPATAKVVRAGVHPVKVAGGTGGEARRWPSCSRPCAIRRRGWPGSWASKPARWRASRRTFAAEDA